MLNSARHRLCRIKNRVRCQTRNAKWAYSRLLFVCGECSFPFLKICFIVLTLPPYLGVLRLQLYLFTLPMSVSLYISIKRPLVCNQGVVAFDIYLGWTERFALPWLSTSHFNHWKHEIWMTSEFCFSQTLLFGAALFWQKGTSWGCHSARQLW